MVSLVIKKVRHQKRKILLHTLARHIAIAQRLAQLFGCQSGRPINNDQVQLVTVLIQFHQGVEQLLVQCMWFGQHSDFFAQDVGIRMLGKAMQPDGVPNCNMHHGLEQRTKEGPAFLMQVLR